MRLFATLYKVDEDTPNSFIGSFEVSPTVRFGTQLNGGYSTMGAVLPMPLSQSRTLYRYVHNAQVVIDDLWGTRVYEGRIYGSVYAPNGLAVEGAGHYTEAARLIFGMVYPYIEEGHNLCPNPSFEVDVTTSWSITPSGSVAQAADSWTNAGDFCAEITQSTADNVWYGFSCAVTGGSRYALSVYCKNVDTQQVPFLVYYVAGGSGITNTWEMSGFDDTWRRYTYIVETLVGDHTAYFAVGIPVVPGGGTVGSFMVDAVSLEHQAYPSEYFDGDSGTLCGWDSTAHASTSYRTAYSPTVGDVFSDAVGYIETWSTHTMHVVGADLRLSKAEDFTEERVKSALEGLLTLGYTDSDPRPLYFAMWEQRTAHLFPEPVLWAYPTWVLYRYNLKDAQPSLSSEDVVNRVYSVYDNTEYGLSLYDPPAEDAYSQHEYGVREGRVDNGELPVVATGAAFLQDAALERYKTPRLSVSTTVSGIIQDGSGGLHFPYRIRAGDTVVIRDVDIGVTEVDSGGVTDGVAALVLSSEYDGSSKESRVTLGSGDKSFDVLMTRLGLSGGLV